VTKSIQVIIRGVTIADTRDAWRVLETSHPPVYYIPASDILMEYLSPSSETSSCEWKGRAVYYDVVVNNQVAKNAAWSYPSPTPAFRTIQDHLAFYAWAMDQCLVDGEQVRPQPGNFYGGWITDNIVGPFKGEPGTWGW
jgi:uncharacterized protein (DUF427 family)